MKTQDIDSFSYNGKNYSLLSRTFQDAFYAFGLFTLRYYPQEKLLIVSDKFAEFFHIQKVFSNMPSGFSDVFLIESEKEHFKAFIEKLEKGEPKIFDFFEMKNGHTCRLTLVVCDHTKDGTPLTTIGLLEDVEDERLHDKMFKALGRDFGSVYCVDAETGFVRPFRISDEIEQEYGEKIHSVPDYNTLITTYIKNTVLEDEQAEMSKICNIKNIESVFKDGSIFLHDYRGRRNGKLIYCRMKIANISKGDKFTDFMIAFSDMTKTKTCEIERLAFIDPVTEGNNYNYFKRKVLEIGKPGYFVSMDIHQFKTINQICGVQAGDDILKEIWKTLIRYVKKSDVCARVNADHFIVYAYESSKAEIIKIAERLSTAMTLLSLKLRSPRINPYFGIAKWDISKKIEEVYSYTTFAKHNAKAGNGSLNYQFYSEEESNRITEQKTMEDNFAEAIMNDNFKVWFQPKVDPITEKIVGAEALVRWQLKTGDFLPPGKFIPVFEKDGLIRILDEYIFATVCHFIKKRLENGQKVIPISVNLSRASICYEGIAEQYAKIVQSMGIDAKYVPIEITESAAASNTSVLELSNKFRQNGFALCMDDFGTGYSSMSLLSILPFENIKLDKSLIDGIGDTNGFKLIKHIIALSKDMGLTITAEGVEHEEQKNTLLSLKCDNIQGFYYKPPLPEQEFVKLL